MRISDMRKAMRDVLNTDPANSALAAPPFWHAVSFAGTRLVCMVRDVVLV